MGQSAEYFVGQKFLGARWSKLPPTKMWSITPILMDAARIMYRLDLDGENVLEISQAADRLAPRNLRAALRCSVDVGRIDSFCLSVRERVAPLESNRRNRKIDQDCAQFSKVSLTSNILGR